MGVAVAYVGGACYAARQAASRSIGAATDLAGQRSAKKEWRIVAESGRSGYGTKRAKADCPLSG